MVRPIEQRLVRVALALAAIGTGCSGDGDGPRAFELDVRPADNDKLLEAPDLSDEWAHVEVEIVEAPRKVTAGGDDFPLVLEMRNTLDDTVSMDPCPVWEAGMGESSEVSKVEGTLPCEAIGSLGPHERIRLRMTMPPTELATESQGLEPLVGLGWRLKGEFFQETSANAAFMMDGPR